MDGHKDTHTSKDRNNFVVHYKLSAEEDMVHVGCVSPEDRTEISVWSTEDFSDRHHQPVPPPPLLLSPGNKAAVRHDKKVLSAFGVPLAVWLN